jgi:hypothetical protein
MPRKTQRFDAAYPIKITPHQREAMIACTQLKATIMCLEGERACPPEDCGGPWGFTDDLEALADPKHEEHEELLGWRGPFDPEAFDAKKVAREMRKT